MGGANDGIPRALSAILVWLLLTTATISNGWTKSTADRPTIHLQALRAAARVGLTGPAGGADSVEVACAKNEVESFQVVVTAKNGKLKRVDASISPLKDRSGNILPSACVDLFSAVFVPIRMPDPRALLAPGLWPDPLVPFHNPYTGEPVRGPKWGKSGFTGERFRGKEFDLWQDQQRPLWVDVRVPKDAVPGVYTGTFKVWAKNADPVELPVQVEVWNFTLADGPTHENHFGGFGQIANYHGLPVDSEEFQLLEDRYSEMLAAHRINPPLPRRLHPPAGPGGAVRFEKDLDQRLSAFVAKYNITNIEIPHAPFGDASAKERAKTAAFYSSWFDYLESKGWAERSYLYMVDEPQDAEAYQRVRRLGASVRQAEPRLRRVVVEQPYPEDPRWGRLDDAVDIWCPLFGFLQEESVRRVQKAGDEVWTYTALVQSVPDYHPDYEKIKDELPPFWQIDFPALSYRIAPWLNRRYGATGLLYWSTCCWGNPMRNPWDNPALGDHWNGEGAFFYPGSDAGIEGPVGSVRLKNLRDSMEDYEYFVLLENLGGEETVKEIVKQAVPTWGHWDQDAERLESRRKQLAEAILRLQ
jgi:glycosyl hydrolase family 123